MLETLTAIAAVVGAVAGLVAAAGVFVVNGKVDRLEVGLGRVEERLAGQIAAVNTRIDNLLLAQHPPPAR